MNKLFISLLFLPLLFISCKSNEEKAAELIENKLSKTLYDFESYSPIETIVTEANLNEYTDTTCWFQAQVLVELFKLVNENLNKAQNAQDNMDIWGPPSYYSSSYSNRKYYEYKEEYDNLRAELIIQYSLLRTMASALKDSINSLDNSVTIGWEVKHKYRCKTRGGYSTISDYRYVIDENFEKILIEEDCDDDAIRAMIFAAKEDQFKPLSF